MGDVVDRPWLFGVGNVAALRHGATSTRVVAPLADRLAGELASVAPWTASAAFAGAVRSWAWAEAQTALLRLYVDEHGLIDADGAPRPALVLLDRAEATAARCRDELGLTPRALGKLLQSAASVASATGDTDSLDALRREGARILAARGQSSA